MIGNRMLRSFGGYAALQALSFVAPFAALPVIARTAGARGWVDLASAQAIGTFAGVVILYGWWTAGPGEYFQLNSREGRVTLYRRSLYGRLVISALVLPATAVVIVLMVSPEWRAESVLMAIATAMAGFSPSWYFVAAGSPAKLAIYETLPRVFATLLAVLAMADSGSVMPYPVLLLASSILAYGAAMRIETPRRLAGGVKFAEVRKDLVHHTPIALSNLVGALYSQMTVPIAAGIAPHGVVAQYVSADKLYRASRFTIVALGNTLQPWALQQPTARRHLKAITTHAIFGGFGGLLIALTTPSATRILFGEGLEVDYEPAAYLGMAFFATSVTTPIVRNILIPQGNRTAPLVGTVVAALVGLGSIWPLYTLMGMPGIALAVGLSEITNMSINIVAARSVFSKRRVSGKPVQAHDSL